MGVVGSELAALRETVRALDPAFEDVLEKKRQATSLAEGTRETTRLLDDAILKLKADLIQ